MGFPKYAEDIQRSIDNCRHFANLDGFEKDGGLLEAKNHQNAQSFYTSKEKSLKELQLQAKKYADELTSLLEWLTSPELSVEKELTLRLQERDKDLEQVTSQNADLQTNTLQLESELKAKSEELERYADNVEKLEEKIRQSDIEKEKLALQLNSMELKLDNHHLMSELGVRRR